MDDASRLVILEQALRGTYGTRLARAEIPLVGLGVVSSPGARVLSRDPLVTDTAGKALLVDRMGLEFAEVSTELDRLRDVDPGWWPLGKLIAYNLQDRPFVHLDNDVFLWRALPAALPRRPFLRSAPSSIPCRTDGFGPARGCPSLRGMALLFRPNGSGRRHASARGSGRRIAASSADKGRTFCATIPNWEFAW